MHIVRKKEVLHPELSFKVNGILFKVRKEQGKFKSEKQFCDAIEQELINEQIEYEREKVLDISFEGEQKGRSKVDFYIAELIPVEIKSKGFITKGDYYQIKRYLECLDRKLGILVNMRSHYINPKRILNPKGKV